MLSEISSEQYDAACEAKQLFENFAAYARKQAAEGDELEATA